MGIERTSSEMILHQQKSIHDLLYRFTLQDAHPVSTPLPSDFQLHPRKETFHVIPLFGQRTT